MNSRPENTTERGYSFPANRAIKAARDSLADLEGRVPPETLEQLKLLVSELATNAVRHTGLGSQSGPDGHVGLRLVVFSGRVRVEVTDPGPGFETPDHPSPDSDRGSGYGLYLVDRLANRWGVESGDLNRVWLELDYGS